jgi:hypothetical protein
MILYYAPGGGLGHLTRGRRVLETLGLTGDATFVTASRYADDARVTGGAPVLALPARLEGDVAAHRQWLREIAVNADRVIVDTFPAGIQGELSSPDAPLPRMDLVARSLRWDSYRGTVDAPLPHFDTVWTIEPLEPAHEAALRGRATKWVALELCVPSAPSRPMSDYWLIVHSGPEDEVRELVGHAAELQRVEQSRQRVLVATRCTIDLPGGFELVDAYPVTQLLAGATRIISGAGYNVMLETSRWSSKHHAVPFPRPFDDQYARARRRRESR